MKRISILLLTENSIFLHATIQFLEMHSDVLDIARADKDRVTWTRVQNLRPQIILVDLEMPNLFGLDGIHHLRSMLPGTGIVAMTLLKGDVLRQATLAAGADAFIYKANMRAELMPTIQRIAQTPARNGSGGHTIVPEADAGQ